MTNGRDAENSHTTNGFWYLDSGDVPHLRRYYGWAHEYRLRSSMEPDQTELGVAADRQAT